MMLNQHSWGHFSNIRHQLTSSLFEIDVVKAFWLHGSRAINTHYNDSDLDLAVVYDGDGKIEIVKRLCKYLDYHPQFGDFFSDTTSELWLSNGKEVALHFITLDELKNILTQFKADIEGFENTQAFVQHILIESSLIFEKRQIYSNALEDVSSGIPSQIKEKLILKYINILNNKMRWWAIRHCWKNKFEELSDSQLIVSEIARLHYALNNRLYMPGLKEYHNDLKQLQPNLSNEMEYILKISDSESEQRLKKQTIATCIGKLNSHISNIDRI